VATSNAEALTFSSSSSPSTASLAPINMIATATTRGAAETTGAAVGCIALGS